MHPAIDARNLSKAYRLGVINRKTLGEELAYRWLRMRGRDPCDHLGVVDPVRIATHQRKTGGSGWFYALRDVSFEVPPGEALGVIGRNGAGKSTLLKILSRITEPTAGEAFLTGRVGSLLEVGTGFHPELTGRENVFMNGTILGMRTREIERHYEAIVEFSEMREFMDTPVKRYSSGMYVRLAFAVAAHLQPDILIIDEVLAVGDMAYQRKCVDKMEEIARTGRTILFVSHNMSSIAALCSKAIVLQSGRIVYGPGETSGAIECYLRQVTEAARQPLASRTDRDGLGRAIFTGAAFRDDYSGASQNLLSTGQAVRLSIDYKSIERRCLEDVAVHVHVASLKGESLAVLSNVMTMGPFERLPPEGRLICRIPRLPLAAGQYVITLTLRERGLIQDHIRDAAIAVVEPGDFFRTGRPVGTGQGSFFIDHEWRVET
jgi:lipopolysaccharide transport system ATP-binding protein